MRLIGFTAGPAATTFEPYARGAASLALGAFILATSFSFPFTVQFARRSVPQQYWNSPRFLGVNRRISLAWGLAGPTTRSSSRTDTMTTNTADVALTTSKLDHHGTASHEAYTAGFYAGAGEWDFTVRMILGKSSRGGSDVGEVLASVASVQPGDRAGWFGATWAA